MIEWKGYLINPDPVLYVYYAPRADIGPTAVIVFAGVPPLHVPCTLAEFKNFKDLCKVREGSEQ